MPILTEARVRHVYREYQRLMSPELLGGWAPLMRDASLLTATPEERMAAAAPSPTSDPAEALMALGVDHQRIDGIARLIGFLGIDEARAQATELSSRAAAEGPNLFDRPWKYSVWEHALLHIAASTGTEEQPVQPQEVDAVHRALDEILLLDQFLARGFRNAQAIGAALRADPGSLTRRAGPKNRDVEARKWLARTKPTILASNRFGTTEKGREFVEELYAAGAAKVVVPGESMEPDDGEGFAHADELRVHLPKDPDARRRVLDIINREVRREGFDEATDTGRRQETLWWD